MKTEIILDSDNDLECFRCCRLISWFEPKTIHGIVTESGNQRLFTFCQECVEELRS